MSESNSFCALTPAPTLAELNSLAQEFFDGTARLMKFKSPHAQMLACGLKGIENRSWKLPNTEGRWILVVMSKSNPTRAAIQDTQNRLELQGTTLNLAEYCEASKRFKGCIVGAVRVSSATKSPSNATMWHNPPDWAWEVDRAIEFARPIPLDANDKFQIQVRSSSRMQYFAPLLERLSSYNEPAPANGES